MIPMVPFGIIAHRLVLQGNQDLYHVSVALGGSSRVMRGFVHPIEFTENSKRTKVGFVASQRSDYLTILDCNKGIAKAVKVVRDNPPGMIRKWRLPAQLYTIDFVPELLCGAGASRRFCKSGPLSPNSLSTRVPSRQ